MKSNKLERWLNKNKPSKKISILTEYKDDIFELINLNYTQDQIIKFLSDEYKVKTTQQNLSSFINNQKLKPEINEVVENKNIKSLELDDRFSKHIKNK